MTDGNDIDGVDADAGRLLTREEAVAFVDALRLTLGDKVGFQWMVAKLKALTEYIEAIADENERLKRL